MDRELAISLSMKRRDESIFRFKNYVQVECVALNIKFEEVRYIDENVIYIEAKIFAGYSMNS